MRRNHMKKILALLMALVMVFALAACGQKAEAPAAQEAEPTFPFDNDSTPFDVSTLKEDEIAKVKVGFIFLHDENSTYDLNFINAFNDSCAKLGVTGIVKTNVPEGQECYDTAGELVDEGCTVIFADSFGHEDFMIQAAKEYPDVQFCHATGTKAHTEGLANFHNAFAAIYEGRYLAGVAAGMKLNQMIEEGKITADQAKIGYVGAFTYAEVVSGYSSFFLGARSICPSATMDVTFTGSWYDETAEKEGANKLIQGGCVLISQHADSMGAPTACEEAGVPDVSYNGSTVSACPNTFIVASKINWSPYYEYVINAVQNGETMDPDWTGTISTGSVELTEINDQAAAPGTAEKVDEVKAALEAGTAHVYDTSTFTVEGKALDESFQADVDTDPDYAADTAVVSDGYFHESEYRSAPYFQLQIDGINLLDTAF
jgi:basic membrane protein A